MRQLFRMGTDAWGYTMLEVMVSLFILTFVIIGMTSAGALAGAQLRMSRADVGVATAVHYQIEILKAEGYDNVTAGTDTVQGHPMSWTVEGTDPKRIILVVQFDNGRGDVRRDTLVTAMADSIP